MKDITGLGEVAKAGADVVNNVVDKISNAVGVIYSDSTHKMKKDALKKVYDEIVENENIDSFSKAAIISNLKQDLKHYKNQRNIISKAINDIDEDTDVSKIDDDWLNFFFDKAKNVSAEEMQNIWGKMLSEEFNRPNSIPKSLLHTVSCIDVQSANAFNIVCQFIAENQNKQKLLFISLKDFANELLNLGIDFQILEELDRYGLISFNSITGYMLKDVREDLILKNNNRTYVLKPNNNVIRLGDVVLTNDGKALCNCIVKEYNPLFKKMLYKICNKNEIIEL